jgi:two-component system sensor histidine kinase ResE
MSAQVTRNLDSITGNLFPSISRLEAINTSAVALWEASGNVWYISRLGSPLDRPAIEREKLEFGLADDSMAEAERSYEALIVKAPEEYPHASELRRLLTKIRTQSKVLLRLADEGPNFREGDQLAEDIESTLNRLTVVTGLARQLELANLKERESAAREAIRRVTHFSALAILASLLMALVLSFLLLFRLVGPILKLRRAAEDVGSGDLSVRVAVPSEDELGELVRAFNVMVANLQATTISKSFVEGILFSMHEALFIVKPNGDISHVNQAACKLLGISEAEIIGSHIAQYFTVDPTQVFENVSERSREQRLFLKKKAGDNTPVSITHSRIGETAEKESIFVIRDISLQEESAAELRRIREQLVHAQQLSTIGTLSALFAHRLNQPLTVIQLKLQQTLRALSDSSELKPKLSECLEEVRATAAIVKDVLGYAKPRRSTELSPVNLFSVASRITATFAEFSSRRHLEINLENIKGMPSVLAAADEWEEIFYILIENAAHACEENASANLSIYGEIKDGSYEVRFEDNCGGISTEHLPYIFDLFYSTKPRTVGTGLGLSIVKQIVTARGGTVDVKSTLGSGSTFFISLPLYAVQPQSGLNFA